MLTRSKSSPEEQWQGLSSLAEALAGLTGADHDNTLDMLTSTLRSVSLTREQRNTLTGVEASVRAATDAMPGWKRTKEDPKPNPREVAVEELVGVLLAIRGKEGESSEEAYGLLLAALFGLPTGTGTGLVTKHIDWSRRKEVAKDYCPDGCVRAAAASVLKNPENWRKYYGSDSAARTLLEWRHLDFDQKQTGTTVVRFPDDRTRRVLEATVTGLDGIERCSLNLLLVRVLVANRLHEEMDHETCMHDDVYEHVTGENTRKVWSRRSKLDDRRLADEITNSILTATELTIDWRQAASEWLAIGHDESDEYRRSQRVRRIVAAREQFLASIGKQFGAGYHELAENLLQHQKRSHRKDSPASLSATVEYEDGESQPLVGRILDPDTVEDIFDRKQRLETSRIRLRTVLRASMTSFPKYVPENPQGILVRIMILFRWEQLDALEDAIDLDRFSSRLSQPPGWGWSESDSGLATRIAELISASESNSVVPFANQWRKWKDPARNIGQRRSDFVKALTMCYESETCRREHSELFDDLLRAEPDGIPLPEKLKEVASHFLKPSAGSAQ